MTRKPRLTPSMAVAITALVFAMAGSGYAATQLAHGGQAKASKKKARRGPAGPQGLQGPKGDKGDNGKDGTDGTDGSPGAIVFSNRMDQLNQTVGSEGYSLPSGYSTVVSTIADTTMVTPNAALTMTGINVDLENAPGGTSLRSFAVSIDPPGAAPASDSGACIVLSANTSCSVGSSTPIPARSLISIHSTVLINAATPGDARVTFTAQ